MQVRVLPPQPTTLAVAGGPGTGREERILAENTLVAEPRTGTGKSVTRKLRSAGRIPAVLYGRDRDSQALSIETRALDTLLHASGAGRNTLIDLQVSGDTTTVMLKELQREPVDGGYMHADFHVIDLTQTVDVRVPLHFVGKAKGLDFGGIVDHPVREVELACLPGSIPEAIEVDVSPLEMGMSLHIRDLVLPEGVEVKSDGDLTIASCAAPRVVEEEEAAEAVAEGEAAAEGAAPEGAPAEGAADEKTASGDGDS